MSIHESSPGGSSSDAVKRKCLNYSASYYYADTPRGEYRDGYRSEDLSDLTFPDNSFDLFITQDVFENVMEPARAFAEIARVLRPGGAHVFTMPWYPQLKEDKIRAHVDQGEISYLEEPIYHGDPINHEGTLVTIDWGIHFPDFIYEHSGMYTTIVIIKDRALGLDGEFLEAFISRKPQRHVCPRQ
jgi:SAM-dependent methyltransferase